MISRPAYPFHLQRGRSPSAPTLPHSPLLRPNLSPVIPTPCNNLPLKRFHAAIAIVGLQRRYYCERAGASARHLCRPQTTPPRPRRSSLCAASLQGLRVSSVFAAASPQHRGWHRQSANLIMAMFGYNHHLLCRRPATIN